MSRFLALTRRELWEHPALYMGPLGANAFVAISMLLLVARGLGSEENVRRLADGMQISGVAAIETIRDLVFSSPVALVLVVTMFVGYFYFIDCLYAERRDRSILFFKSLPVTDLETVLSKLVSGAIVLPVLSLIAFFGTQLLVLLIASVTFLFVGGSVGGLWQAGTLFSAWLLAAYVLFSAVLWFSPFIGFLLLVSAFAKRAVFLWSLAPLFVAQAEFLVTGQSLIGRLIFGRVGGYWRTAFAVSREQLANLSETVEGAAFSPLMFIDPLGLLSTPSLWYGFLLAGAFIAAAVYLRRYRDDA
jgi:ABC-2 type transport system permease protein